MLINFFTVYENKIIKTYFWKIPSTNKRKIVVFDMITNIKSDKIYRTVVAKNKKCDI